MPINNGANDELDDLARELGLISDPSDLDALRSEVKARISEIHPDHKVVDSTARLQNLRKVLKKVGKGSTALQKIDRSSWAVKAVPAAFARQETVETKLSAIEKTQHIASSRAFLLPKVSLGTLTAALAWVFFFPRTFADHPFIGQMLKSNHAGAVWSGAVLFLATSWFSVWWLERTKEYRTEEVLSLAHQKAALDLTGRTHPEGFSASYFQEQLYPKHVLYPIWLRRLSKVLPGGTLTFRKALTYDAPMAEKVAQLALERFIQKGWITPIPRPEGESSVDDWYKIV